jgi:hypothetical protein
MQEAFCSAGPIENLQEDQTHWGLHPFVGKKAHHWKVVRVFEGGAYLISDCGNDTAATTRVPLLNPGNWPKCKLCGRLKK